MAVERDFTNIFGLLLSGAAVSFFLWETTFFWLHFLAYKRNPLGSVGLSDIIDDIFIKFHDGDHPHPI
jgi:hypothetical protein